MKLISTLMLLFIFFSCIEKEKEATFDCIDYSLAYSFDARDAKCIKIFKDRQTLISFNNFNYERKMYYSLTLDKVSMDSISSMTEKLSNEKLDTIFQSFGADHPTSLSLIIKSKKGTIITSYRGDCYEEKLNSLFQLTRYLDKIILKVTATADSVFVFESKSRLILPPPPPAPDVIEKTAPNN